MVKTIRRRLLGGSRKNRRTARRQVRKNRRHSRRVARRVSRRHGRRHSRKQSRRHRRRQRGGATLSPGKEDWSYDPTKTQGPVGSEYAVGVSAGGPTVVGIRDAMTDERIGLMAEDQLQSQPHTGCGGPVLPEVGDLVNQLCAANGWHPTPPPPPPPEPPAPKAHPGVHDEPVAIGVKDMPL